VKKDEKSDEKVPKESKGPLMGLERKGSLSVLEQGCQMVCFQTKNPNVGKIWRALE
jgi:hypothetical protein